MLLCCTCCFRTSKLLTLTLHRTKANHWTEKPKTMLPKASGKIKLTRCTFTILWLNKQRLEQRKRTFFPFLESLVKLLHSAHWATQHDNTTALAIILWHFTVPSKNTFFSGKYCVFLMNYLADAKCAEFKWNVCTRGSQEEGPHSIGLDTL